ncbi:MAG: hypothetical protein IJ993_04320, partial [Akkermansia sp.]|nr:hypothetical protein [Akkermansia sp.]
MCARYKPDEPLTPQGPLPPRRRPRRVPEQQPLFPEPEQPAPLPPPEPAVHELPVEEPVHTPKAPARRSYWEVPDYPDEAPPMPQSAAPQHNPRADVR